MREIITVLNNFNIRNSELDFPDLFAQIFKTKTQQNAYESEGTFLAITLLCLKDFIETGEDWAIECNFTACEIIQQELILCHKEISAKSFFSIYHLLEEVYLFCTYRAKV